MTNLKRSPLWLLLVDDDEPGARPWPAAWGGRTWPLPGPVTGPRPCSHVLQGLQVPQQEKGNKVPAARTLDISRRALYRLLDKYHHDRTGALVRPRPRGPLPETQT